MAVPVLANRARMKTSTTGTGTWTLTTAVSGHQTFATAGLANGDRIRYAAESNDRGYWEVGIGTYSSAGPTLTRTTIYDSSNGGTVVNFGAAPEVWVDASTETFRQPYRVVTAAGGVTINAETDDVVVIKKTSGAATAVTLPLSANAVRPITIKDGKGDADTNNITITPNGSETIDGAATWVLNFAYSAVTLNPYPDGTGWFIT